MSEALKQELDEEVSVDIELDDDSSNDDVNPNVADQLEAAGNDNPEADKRTPEERIREYLEQDEELKDYGDGIQKRINKLTYNWREAERREQEAIRFAETQRKELEALRAKQQESDGVFISEYKGRVEAQLAGAKQNLKAAYETGDAELIAEANTNIARFSAELANAESTERRYQNQVRRPAPQQPTPDYVQHSQQQAVQQRQPQRPDPKAESWAEQNKWFGEDRIMTRAALEIHQELVAEEGYQPETDDYYQEIDKRMRRNFPHRFQAEQPRQVVQHNSGVTPGVTNAARRPGKKNVKLSASQVAIAKKLGVPLEEYAKYV